MMLVLILITIPNVVPVTTITTSENSISNKECEMLSTLMPHIVVEDIQEDRQLSIIVISSNSSSGNEEALETNPVDDRRKDELDQSISVHAFHPETIAKSILSNETDALRIDGYSLPVSIYSIDDDGSSMISHSKDPFLPQGISPTVEKAQEFNNKLENAYRETGTGFEETVGSNKMTEITKSNTIGHDKNCSRFDDKEKSRKMKENSTRNKSQSYFSEPMVYSENYRDNKTVTKPVLIKTELPTIEQNNSNQNLATRNVLMETLPTPAYIDGVKPSPSALTSETRDGHNFPLDDSKKESSEYKQNEEIVSITQLDMEQLSVKPFIASLNQHRKMRLENHISTPQLVFPEVPEGDNFHILELRLSEGMFVFSYLSSFLSWIQPHDFPVELLRDALWTRVSIVDLITQSLQVEVGFIICLTLGILLALGVPCILIIHACCHLLNPNKRTSSWNEDSVSDTTNNCAVNLRRCTMVFVVQLILVLLLAGLVSMFLTNEQMSQTVEQTPSVIQTALNDVTTFLRNSHQQIRFVITKSLEKAVDAAAADLDNVEELLGRPIQDELAEETGVDVALDALVDVSVEARVISGRVEDLTSICTDTRTLIVESREQLADLRMQVDILRQQCPPRFRPLCNIVNATGLDVILRLEALMADDRLSQIRSLRVGNLSSVTQEARGEFQLIPLLVEKGTRDARNGVKRQLYRQKDILYESIWNLETVTRDLTFKVETGRSQVLKLVHGISTIEQWRWLTGLGSALCVLLIWLLLLSGISCGCYGAEDRAAPTLLTSLVLMCVLSIALWAVALCAFLIGGHGEVFICRPLYDEPEYSTLTRLVDRPGVLFQHGGGFFSSLLYRNGTIDVLLRDVLQKCQENGSTYSAFQLKKVFDVDAASDHRRWDSLYSELSHVHVNFSDFVLLTPVLQQQLQDLLHASTVNLSNYRSQMIGQVTGKDLQSFADQMSSVANQITDWSTLNRLENIISTTRNLISSHIQPLEQRKEDIIYQLTTLEMQLSPLQRQVNQSLSHFKTIQYFINNQGGKIANQKSQEYKRRLIDYMDQYRSHVLNNTQKHVAPCRPLWDLYHSMRLLFCRHIIDPLNGFWFATVWCLLLFLAATPLCLKLIDHYKQVKQTSGLLQSRRSE